MTTPRLLPLVEEYLAYRRGLGFALETPAWLLRDFARYRALLEPGTEVPPAGLLGRVPHRRQAHIYSNAELVALLREASLLLPREGLRPRTYSA